MASLSSVERFNPHLNKWMEVCEMGQRRAGNGVSKLNGCLYVVGERNVMTCCFVFVGAINKSKMCRLLLSVTPTSHA